MKTTKPVLLFYNSILIISLVTIGFVTQSYADLTPTLLLIPVGAYFIFALVDHFFNITHLFDYPSLTNFRRILGFYSLIIILLLIFANLATSTSFLQSTLSIVLLPLIISFVMELFDKNNINQFKLKKIISIAKFFNPKRKEKIIKLQTSASKAKKVVEQGIITSDSTSEELTEEAYTESEEVSEDEVEDLLNVKDKTRRQFLKIIGGGGVSLFLMMFVFKDKANAAFFGSAPGPGVVSVKNIAGEKIDPAEKQPTDGYNVSEIDDSNSPAYYGFVHQNGAWYIAKEDSSGAYRYVSGASAFSTSWTNRVSLTYDYFDNIF